MKRERTYFFHVTCAPGLEGVLQEEIEDLGPRRIRAGRGAVRFQGSYRLGLKVALWSQVASRVLVELIRVPARDADELYESIIDLPWEEKMDEESTFAIDVIGTSDTLRHTHYTGQRIKDAICDRLRDLWGVRPDVDPHNPELLIVGRLHKNQCTLSFDLVGERLHRRGYRVVQVEAPLKENLAAAILRLAGWDGKSPLIDPMCGGGTFLIEAAMRASQMAPGENLRPACTNWLWNGKELTQTWDELVEHARDKALEDCPTLIQGRDISADAIRATQKNARKAGVLSEIDLKQGDARDLQLPQGPGWIVCNPPYGERLETPKAVKYLMDEFGKVWKDSVGFHLAIITPWEDLPDWIGVEPTQVIPMRNGKIPCFLFVFPPNE